MKLYRCTGTVQFHVCVEADTLAEATRKICVGSWLCKNLGVSCRGCAVSCASGWIQGAHQ
jgi:hypothetical protein